MSHRTSVLQLESDFADAMNRMYAVGNGLARLRSEIDREDAVGSPARRRRPARSPPVTARAPVRPGSRPPARPGPAPAPPPRPSPAWHAPRGRRPLPRRSSRRASRRSPGTAARAP